MDRFQIISGLPRRVLFTASAISAVVYGLDQFAGALELWTPRPLPAGVIGMMFLVAAIKLWEERESR